MLMPHSIMGFSCFLDYERPKASGNNSSAPTIKLPKLVKSFANVRETFKNASKKYILTLNALHHAKMQYRRGSYATCKRMNIWTAYVIRPRSIVYIIWTMVRRCISRIILPSTSVISRKFAVRYTPRLRRGISTAKFLWPRSRVVYSPYTPPFHGLLGRAQRPPHLWWKRKIVYIFIYLYIYLHMVRAYSIYAFCPICARCNISALHIRFMYYCLLKRQD